VNPMLAADYPFLDVMWTIFIFFAWIIFIWLLIMVLADNFRRTDHSGWAKAGWTLFVIFVPVLGILVYMIARPKMTEQDKQLMAQAEAERKRMAESSAADETSNLQRLKDEGAISAEEFEKLKAQALA